MGESVVGGRAVAWPEMGRWARIWLTVYVAVAAVDLIAETAHLFWVALVALIAALPALAAVLATSRRSDRLRHWVLAALFFGWLGDWLGDLLVPHIAWKIGFFFLGHVCFLVAFWPYRSRSVLDRPGLLACYALGITALLAWVVPSAGWLYGSALVAYGLTLGSVAVLATGLGSTATVGGIVFIVSDMSIAVTSFVYPGRLEHAELLIMSTYLVAQLLLVLGVIDAPDPGRAGRRRPRRRAPAIDSSPTHRTDRHTQRSREGSTMTLTAADLLDLSQAELDDLFRASPAGPIPAGEGDGTLIFAPDTVAGELTAKLVHLIAWKGKIFDPERGDLRNEITPFGIDAIRAKVFYGTSWFDGAEAIIIDYSETSLVAQWIRDEIRLVAPGLYLGVVFWDDTKILNFSLRFDTE